MPTAKQRPSPYDRRRLARERLEVYLVNLLLRNRFYLLFPGFLLLLVSIAVMINDPPAGLVVFLPGALLCLVSSSYNGVLYTARAVAWLATLGRRDM
jgi:hypothetical protein